MKAMNIHIHIHPSIMINVNICHFKIVTTFHFLFCEVYSLHFPFCLKHLHFIINIQEISHKIYFTSTANVLYDNGKKIVAVFTKINLVIFCFLFLFSPLVYLFVPSNHNANAFFLYQLKHSKVKC